ncbi:hypothetical protein MN116_004611 [Schistosoma mekongi]|uniref:RRM domain-containing protein n=1 Tax=Schistosoma mekongi TaxID=38744 RepID=A0AAE1ZD85_SCHME|nr:hypothetical protein MN116_004611 [Schistosoma mekongi]
MSTTTTTTNNNNNNNLIEEQNNQNITNDVIDNLCEHKKYTYVQENGQRRYGPPLNWQCEAPPRGCEVFIGKIPRDCFEDELIPIFEQIGPIYMFRLMMELNGINRGFGFCVYTNKEDTKRAVQELNNYEIRKGKTIGVCLSVDNCRLFVGGIPKNKTREEILSEMRRVTEGVKDVISYPSVTDKTKNRGFAFIEYGSHKAAAMARRKLLPGHIHLWGHQIAVDWAEPEREVNEDIMSKVKILYVRNLMLSTTEESLRDSFIKAAGGDPNSVERVKKISDYAFIHFREREQAAQCLHTLNDTYIDGSKIEVTWAKPVDKNEVNTRQQPCRTSGKLINELTISNDQNMMAAAAAVVAAGGILPQLDTTSPFFLSSPGQGTTPMPTDLLSANSNIDNSGRTDINLGSPGGIKLNCPRTGRRNAAGSRSAGVQKDRKHPVEVTFITNYGVPMNSSILHSNTCHYIPLSLTNNMPTTSTTPLNLLQSHTNILQLTGNANYALNPHSLTTIQGNLPTNQPSNTHLQNDCSPGNLMNTSIDYTSSLFTTGSLGNNGLINTPFNNQPTYYFDANSISAASAAAAAAAAAAASMLITPNGLSTTNGNSLPQLIGLQQSLPICPNEYGQNTSSSTMTQSINTLPRLSGLHNLGLQIPLISPSTLSLPTSNCTTQTSTVINVLNQSYTNPTSVVNGSLSVTNSMNEQNSQTTLSMSS